MCKRIYKNFEDWWCSGKHGFTSYSREYAKEIWEDLEPTILAQRSDWEEVLRRDSLKLQEKYIKQLQNVYAYLKAYDLEKHAGIKFFRWLLEHNRK